MIRTIRILRLLTISAVIGATMTSCLSVDRFAKEEKIRIESYIGTHTDISFELMPSGLYYATILEGSGIMPEAHDTAYIFYEAKYLTDIVFSTNFGTTDTLIAPVSEGYLIPGFDEAVSYMKVGGKSKALVPSELGYGNTGYYFPAYTPIVFDIHLIKVMRGPGAK